MTPLQTALIPLYYLHDFLWRICRASADPRLGRFRVYLLLLLIEAMALSSTIALIARALRMQDAILPTILLVILVMAGLNEYLFTPHKRRMPYVQRFGNMSKRMRAVADALTLVAGVLLLFSPIMISA